MSSEADEANTRNLYLCTSVNTERKEDGFFFTFSLLRLLRLLLLVVVSNYMVGGRCGVAHRRPLPLQLRVPLSIADVVELVLSVELYVHLGLHPQPLRPTRVLTVTGCGGLCGPVRLHVIGQ